MANDIHPTAIIDENVQLGEGNVIGAYSVITGDVVLGDDNWIAPFVAIGQPPEHRGSHAPGKPPTFPGKGIRIGSRCIIHEHVAIHAPTVGETRVGDEAFIMNGSYLAHDVVLEDGVTLSSNVLLGGHVFVGAFSNLGMGTAVHQFRRIGQLCMVGMNTTVTRDLQPFALAMGSPARMQRVNTVGIERSNLPEGLWIADVAKPVDSWDLESFPQQVRELTASFFVN